MTVKDKLELERLYAFLDDLDSMYNKEEISEETYSEMRKKYKDKISDIQDRIIEFDKTDDMEAISKELKEATDDIIESTSQITENVNEILKKTMKTLKQQLKSSGIESPCCKSVTSDETIRYLMGEDDYVYLKCDLESGKMSIKGIDGNEVRIFAEKKSREESEEKAKNKLKKIELMCKDMVMDKKHLIKIETDVPKYSMINLSIEVPNKARNMFKISNEKGNISIKEINCDEFEIGNANGSIELRNVKCKLLNLSTETGSINLENVQSENDIVLNNENGNIGLSNVTSQKLKAYTEKGNISASLATRAGDISTELGSIKFKTIKDIPQNIKLSSELGSIKIDVKEMGLPWMVTARVDLGSVKNNSGLKRLKKEKRFVSVGKDVYNERIEVHATTDLGSITLNSHS